MSQADVQRHHRSPSGMACRRICAWRHTVGQRQPLEDEPHLEIDRSFLILAPLFDRPRPPVDSLLKRSHLSRQSLGWPVPARD